MDQEFHELIAKMSSNMVLNFARDPVHNIFISSYKKVMAHRFLPKEQLLEAHQAIAKAIRSKNADKAEHCMRKHVQDFTHWMKLTGVKLDKLMPRVVKLF